MFFSQFSKNTSFCKTINVKILIFILQEIVKNRVSRKLKVTEKFRLRILIHEAEFDKTYSVDIKKCKES